MEYIGIGFILLCYFFGKAELCKQQHLQEVALIILLPEEERAARIRQILADDE